MNNTDILISLVRQRDEEINRTENILSLNLKIEDIFTKKLFFSIYDIYPKAKLKYEDGLLFIEGVEDEVNFNIRCEIYTNGLKPYIEISDIHSRFKEMITRISIERKLYKVLKKFKEYYLQEVNNGREEMKELSVENEKLASELANKITDICNQEPITLEILDKSIEIVKQVFYTNGKIKEIK